MKTIKKGNIHTIARFDREDFLNHNEDINDLMLKILATYETANDAYNIKDAKRDLEDLNVDIFTKDYLQVRLYVLLDEQTGTPLCFALYSQDKTRDDWHLEFISTNKEYCGMGYAEAVFLASAKDISKTDLPYISSVVNEDNYASLALHDALGDIEGVKLSSCKMDNEDELFDEYMDNETDYDDYSSEQKGYANRISFLFDVKGLQKQDNFDVIDDIIL